MGKRLFAKTTFGLFVCLLAVCISFPVHAAYPESPITVIVPYPPGGATDFQTRVVTMLSSKESYLGQPMIIVNKPGAGGKVGWNWIADKAPRDGYLMSVYNVPHFIAQSVHFNTKYNWQSFEPLANWGADPACLYVPGDSPFNSVADLVAYAKENPGKVTCNGAGLYVGHHIAFLQFTEAAGIKMTYIPGSDGMVLPIQAVLSGQVMAGFNNLSDCYRNQARVKILAIADLERHEYLPEVKTFKEMGYTEVDRTSVNFRGVAFPKGTPEELINQCSNTMLKMFKDPKVAQMMKNGGCPVKIMSRNEVLQMFAERQKALFKLYGKK